MPCPCPENYQMEWENVPCTPFEGFPKWGTAFLHGTIIQNIPTISNTEECTLTNGSVSGLESKAHNVGVSVEVEQHGSKDADWGRELLATESDEAMSGCALPSEDAHSIIKTNSAQECRGCMDIECRSVSSMFYMWFIEQQPYRPNPGEEWNFILLSIPGISGFPLLAEEAKVNF